MAPADGAVILTSPAKLNLFLHITGRRPDGYHNLQTVFQLLDFGDTLAFTVNDSGAITLDDGGLGIPAGDNLVVRAARRLQRGTHGVHIRLDKRIPQGGLGGGSSNAATTLLALNRLWSLGLPARELLAIGGALGADVPVFLHGHSAWAEGTGDELTALELPERWYLVLVPDCHVATGQIFCHSELTRNSPPIKMAAFFTGESRNDCEALVRRLYPAVDEALDLLQRFGTARLTGTGACVFTAFERRDQALAAQAQLPDRCRSFVARGINRSPVPGILA